MKDEILRDLQEGSLDALRLFAALFSAPYIIAREFILRPPGEPFRWPRDAGRASAIDD